MYYINDYALREEKFNFHKELIIYFYPKIVNKTLEKIKIIVHSLNILSLNKMVNSKKKKHKQKRLYQYLQNLLLEIKNLSEFQKFNSFTTEKIIYFNKRFSNSRKFRKRLSIFKKYFSN